MTLDKYTKYSAIIIILFSVIVLSLTSVYHVSGDGCWHIPAGKFIAENVKIPLHEPLGRDEPFWSPPLYHIIVAIVYSAFNLFSHNAANFAVKFVSPVFGILSLIFSFLAIKKIANSKIGFYSTVFLAFIPIFIDYSVISYVESTLVFFVILSVYFIANDKIVLSGIAAGLSILTKYNGVFILPVLVFYLYQKYSKKTFIKKSAIIVSLSLLVASPWLIRNWVLLGNPIWPFLNFAFSGLEAKAYSGLDIGRLLHYNTILFTYFGIFGVPDGNYYNAFSLIDVPYFGILFIIWLAGTLFFVIPLFLGFLNKNVGHKKCVDFFIVWIAVHIILFLLYVMNVGWAVSRIMLPAFPAIAVFWALGYEKLLSKAKHRKLLHLLMAAVIIGFIFTAFAKVQIAANAWDYYKADFDWVKSNTGKDAVFIANGQCVPYNIQRVSLTADNENINKADYVWANQNFKPDSISILKIDRLKMIESQNYRVAYNNSKTGTLVYKTRK